MKSEAVVIFARRGVEEDGEILSDLYWNSETGWVENRFQATIFPLKHGENLARWLVAPRRALKPVAVSANMICPCCGGKVQISE